MTVVLNPDNARRVNSYQEARSLFQDAQEAILRSEVSREDILLYAQRGFALTQTVLDTRGVDNLVPREFAKAMWRVRSDDRLNRSDPTDDYATLVNYNVYVENDHYLALITLLGPNFDVKESRKYPVKHEALISSATRPFVSAIDHDLADLNNIEDKSSSEAKQIFSKIEQNRRIISIIRKAAQA